MDIPRISIDGEKTNHEEFKSNMELRHDINKDEDDMDDSMLEKMLMEAERLAAEMRAASREYNNGSSIISERWPTADAAIPETIDMQDNQTECSSIGIGNGFEHTKWSPSGEYATIPEGGTDTDDIPLRGESSFQDSQLTKHTTERPLSPRSSKRNIEELMKKSRASVSVNDTILLNSATVKILPIHENNKNIQETMNTFGLYLPTTNSNQLSKKSFIDDEHGSVATMYHDAKTAVHEETKVDNLEDSSVSATQRIHSSLSDEQDAVEFWKPSKDVLESNFNDKKSAVIESINHPNERLRLDVVKELHGMNINEQNTNLDKVLQASEELERAMKALQGETSSDDLYNDEGEINEIVNIPTIQECQQTVAGLDFFNQDTQKTPKQRNDSTTRSSLNNWEKGASTLKNNDDFVQVADYVISMTSPVRVKQDYESSQPRHDATGSKVKWEQVSSAKAGDEDYVSLKDYMTLPPRSVESELYNYGTEQLSFATNRASLQRRRKRRRRLVRIGISFLFCGIGLYLLSMDSVEVKSRLQALFLELTALYNEIIHLRYTTSDNFYVGEIIVEESEEIETQQILKYYFSVLDSCSIDCSKYFQNDDAYEFAVPTECFGVPMIQTVVQEPVESHTELEHLTNLPIFCKLPLVNKLPACREAKRRYEENN